MKTQMTRSNGLVGSTLTQPGMVRQFLLACGILAALLYVIANDVLAASLYPGYSRITQPVSLLSATFAPSRPLLVPLLVIYFLLLIAFGVGVWQSAQAKRAVRVTSGLIIGGSVLGIAGLAFPMTHFDLNDTMHNLLNGIAPLIMFVTIGFGATASGKGFRLYSILSLIVLFIGGIFLGTQTAQVAAGETVHWFGITERILIGAWLLWLTVLASALLTTRTNR